jgi:predicted DNA binding CopG/RHH family protein
MDQTKPIFLRVPEREYMMFKVFIAKNGLNMQQFMRNAAKYFIAETERHKKSESNPSLDQEC